MNRCIVAWVAVFVVLAPTAARARPGRSGAIPTGWSWYCFTGDAMGQCKRLRDECENIREQYAKRDPSEAYTPCKEQKKAAVVTLLDVLHDKQRYIAAPTFGLCNALRKGFLASPGDYASVSSCKAIGERRSRLRVKAGKGPYYCNATVFMRKSTGGIFGDTCRHSLPECRADIEEQTKQSPESDPLEVVLDCEERAAAYAIEADNGSGDIVLHPSWCDGCDLVW